MFAGFMPIWQYLRTMKQKFWLPSAMPAGLMAFTNASMSEFSQLPSKSCLIHTGHEPSQIQYPILKAI